MSSMPDNAQLASPAPRPATDRASMAAGLAMTAVFDIGVALLVFNLATAAGWSDQISYLAAGIGPLLSIAITWLRVKRLSGFSVVILVFLLVSSLALFVGGSDSRLLIVKDALVTGLFGAVILVSRAFPKPLMFYMGAKFATDGTRAGLDWWYGLWQYPDFRASQYRITYVWAFAFLIEAAVKIGIAYAVPSFQTAKNITEFLPLIALAVAITVTIRESIRTRQAAVERIAAAESATPAEATADGQMEPDDA